MNKRRKVLWGLAVITLCVVFTVALCACDSSLHTHTFEAGFSGKDETGHWHKATCEHTNEISGKAEHTFKNNVCADCGYEKGTEPPKTVTVSLNYNGATGDVSSIVVTVGKPIGTLSTPKRGGYEFLGWQLDGKDVTAETVWTSENETIVLKAQWMAIEYTVTFVADGKTVKTETYTVENKNITVPAVPAKTGHNGV